MFPGDFIKISVFLGFFNISVFRIKQLCIFYDILILGIFYFSGYFLRFHGIFNFFAIVSQKHVYKMETAPNNPIMQKIMY